MNHAAPDSAADLQELRELNLFQNLAEQEANTLMQRMPDHLPLRDAYLAEIRNLLPRLSLQNRAGLHIIGPYLIPALGDCLLLLACIRLSLKNGSHCINLRRLASVDQGWLRYIPTHPERDIPACYDEAIAMEQGHPADSISLPIAKKLIESFMDEVIRQCAHLDWSVGIMKSYEGWWYHEKLRDLLWSPGVIFRWLLETAWLKVDTLWERDWKTLMAQYRLWDMRNHYDLDYDQVERITEWNCEIARHYRAWHATLPSGLEYFLVPLTTKAALDQEAQALNNICNVFWQSCPRGEHRYFSIQTSLSRKRIGTLLIHQNYDTLTWEHGGINSEEDNELDLATLPDADSAKKCVAIFAQSAMDWYNRHRRQKDFSFKFEFVASLDADGNITAQSGEKSIYSLKLTAHSSADCIARYVALCIEHERVLLGPGYAGPWPECEKELFDDGCPRSKMEEIKRLAKDVKVGDLIIIRDERSILATGEVTGGYEWLAGYENIGGWSMQHARHVDLLGSRAIL